ncbi:MAG TPA: hypothetical protein VHD38_00200, partial [Candidatus Paceibacterota bacterium]|nr:hypothetical protein [Candidatus Paceibacterota bacterium]
TLLYLFERPGKYVLETSYRDADSNDIAVTSFPISVSSAGAGISVAYLIAGACFIVGMLIGVFAGRRFVRPRTINGGEIVARSERN